ncbi:hypothetical protein FA10DRAFT_263140 [Acaromyces ingoldii]|uniref:Apple domain-containing protein n=1 Tax=Acaromyces ingoldii TaxID=215250 RepID=A0A316YDH8_9BASI|nr:hypothetical protein FA10DRAFT_263140 [Acaromyces ingoldii]PWN86904.1 hypothetical protein FA10DRAFT_263140 [Acaromyces ingoldii]
MQITSLAFLVLASLSLVRASAKAPSALGKTGGARPVYVTEEKCVTQLGTKKVRAVPTQTHAATFTLQYPIFVKSTATSTVTPVPVTSTVTSTSTATSISTDSTVTDTLTVTSTPSATTTSTETDTETDTATTTTTTFTTSLGGTTTIPAGAGFTPVSQQISGLGDTYSRRSHAEEGLEAHAGSLLVRTVRRAASTLHKIAKDIAQDDYRASQKNGHSHPDTFNLDHDVYRHHYFRFYQTQTQTLQIPTSTAYAACQANNIVSRINGESMNDFSFAGDLGDVSATSALDCCQQCQALALADPTACRAFFYYNNDGGVPFCFIFVDTLDQPQYVLYLAADSAVDYIVGNGPGGQVVQIS